MDIIEMLAMMRTIDTIELIDNATKGLILARETLIKTGLPEELVMDVINERAEHYTEMYQAMTLEEIKDSLM